jgi:Domain of unknown function (DUF4145)
VVPPLQEWPADFDTLKAELEGASDRAAITVGASLVELALSDCLKAVLRRATSAAEAAKLFGPGGIIETFSQKISACYFLNIVSSKLRNELDTIRKIRNIAAHHLDPVTFDDQQVADLCKNLVSFTSGLKDKTNRKKFLTVVTVLTGLLIAHSIQLGRPAEGVAAADSPLKRFRLGADDGDDENS